jgi:hypothetical protein
MATKLIRTRDRYAVGRGHEYYGKLNIKNLDPEAHRIWLTRDDELEPLPQFGFSHDFEVDCESGFVTRNFVQRMLDAVNLSEKEWFVVERIVIFGDTLQQAGVALDVSGERVRHIFDIAMRKFRVAYARRFSHLVERP